MRPKNLTAYWHTAIDQMVIESVEKVFEIRYYDWMRRKKNGSYSRAYPESIPRMTMIYLLHEYTGYIHSALGKLYGIDRASVYHAIKAITETYMFDREFGAKIKECDLLVRGKLIRHYNREIIRIKSGQ